MGYYPAAHGGEVGAVYKTCKDGKGAAHKERQEAVHKGSQEAFGHSESTFVSSTICKYAGPAICMDLCDMKLGAARAWPGAGAGWWVGGQSAGGARQGQGVDCARDKAPRTVSSLARICFT